MAEILHQLRLVVYPTIYWGLAPSQLVNWDFFQQQYVVIHEIHGSAMPRANHWAPKSLWRRLGTVESFRHGFDMFNGILYTLYKNTGWQNDRIFRKGMVVWYGWWCCFYPSSNSTQKVSELHSLQLKLILWCKRRYPCCSYQVLIGVRQGVIQ